MHSKILVAAAGLSLAFASVSAQAMPAGSVDGASAAPQITLAAEGCGAGFALGPGGACRPIRRAVVRPLVRVRPVVRARPGCGVRVGPVAVHTGC